MGSAEPQSQVRLGAPTGGAIMSIADRHGVWMIRIPPSSQVRLFGLSMIEGPRVVQAEGYLAVTPTGQVGQLRAGAGAAMVAPAIRPTIQALDYDRRGGAMVSGAGKPGERIDLRVDGGPIKPLVVDDRGRFADTLDAPLAPGDHRIEMMDGQGSTTVAVTVSTADPLTGQPFRASATSTGWRIDWLTPGGGLQTTLLFTARETVT